MRGFAFPPTTNTSDWRAPFYIGTEDALITWHPPDDEVILGMSPDTIDWQDYGSHRTSYPPGSASTTPPYFRASSNDGTGYVALINPGLIDIIIPASVMRGFGVGEINVGLRYARSSDSRTSTLFIGRLPVVGGVV
jgi:hypothetical protein